MTDHDQKVQDVDQGVDEAGQAARLYASRADKNSEHRWVPEDGVAGEGQPWDEGFDGELYGGLTSLGFIQAALRRRAVLWCSLALAGLLAGFALLTFLPTTYQAATSLYLTQPPAAPLGWIADDQTVAQSRAVAGLAIKNLGLQESASSLVRDYTVTGVSNRVLLITVKADTSTGALREAAALATSFLTFQAHLLDMQEKLVDASLQQQLVQAQQHVAALGTQISRLSVHNPTASDKAKLKTLEAKRSLAASALTGLRQTINTTEATTRTATTAAVKSSVRLEPAALIKQSTKKRIALFVGGGLVAGLAVGIGVVVIGALLSSRLRRRDEVARALGAPVRLSVGKVRLNRWWPGRRGLAAARSKNVRRILTYLLGATAPGPQEPVSLVVVPVGEVRVAALCVATLAEGCAEQGLRVLVADLCPGAPAARLLGAPRATGVLKVSVNEVRLVVAVPERDDAAPSGPLRSGRGKAEEQLSAACATADLLLTLAALDPGLGGEHLAGWAASAVVMVTAGDSTAAAVQAAGEMVRLAGIPQISAVLVGADKSDESLGVTRPPAGNPPARLVTQSVNGNAGSVPATHNGVRHSGSGDDQVNATASQGASYLT